MVQPAERQGGDEEREGHGEDTRSTAVSSPAAASYDIDENDEKDEDDDDKRHGISHVSRLYDVLV